MARYKEEYQIVNPAGDPVGPPQIFEGETKDEIIAKIKAAHQNAASSFYEAKRKLKLGLMMEPDPESPVQDFTEKPLTADERVRIATELSNPATTESALVRLMEAKLGAPIDAVRENLREIEKQKRADMIKVAIDGFKDDYPEYVESATNRDTMLRYLEKKGWPLTRRNLGIAFEELRSTDDVLTRAKVQPTVPSATVATVEPEPAPRPSAEITQTTTDQPPISEPESAVRPKVSSSGLGRNDSSVGTGGAAPRVQGITEREVRAMGSEEYARRLREEPGFREAVEALFTPKK